MSTAEVLQSQWQDPTGIFAILLIIGGEVIQKALAQLSGYYLVPVAFSFGWVGYSFSTLMQVVGAGRLMPLPDHPVKVINGKSGYCRENRSWVLGRLLRDFEFPLDGEKIGLYVTVFKAVKEDQAGKPEIDWCWVIGILTLLVQLGIAAIPWKLYKDWGIFLVTVWGTVMALFTGTLPQWRSEKWACRRKTDKTLIVTGGNGTRHVLLIHGNGIGLDLEDLAAGENPRMRRRGESSSEFWITQVACSILALAWIVFLISVVGLKENAWFLLAVGGLGMIQNVVVAGAKRGIGTTGIHLKEIKSDSFGKLKVMDALKELDKKHKNVGRCLLGEFFNAKLRDDEKKWWDERENEDGNSGIEDGNSEIEDGNSEIEDGNSEIEDGNSEIEDGNSEIEDGNPRIEDREREVELTSVSINGMSPWGAQPVLQLGHSQSPWTFLPPNSERSTSGWGSWLFS